MFKKFGLYYRTIKHLKPIQIRYRLWYILRDKLRNLTRHSYPLSIPKKGNNLELEQGIQLQISSFKPPKTFTFLNQSHTFEGSIDWNFIKHGKLWAYNLNYFDYLHQPDITKEEGLKLVREFIDQIESNREGLEPYPVSLRGINWIKFLSQYDIKDKEIDASLYAQYQILLDNLEYHLLGNHLLENGCSLLFGAYYFQDEELHEKAIDILSKELEEQILNDGGHFERSTMYHCIMLERLLDCYNLLHHNSTFDQEQLKQRIANVVKNMLGWLEQIKWQNGKVPEVNDHVTEMMPPVSGLFEYSDRLGLKPVQNTLNESGYRKYLNDKFELLVDVGDIGPDYVPGHAHSDIFSFLLRVNGQEIITDTGTSTYENNLRRQQERSSAAHNTVMIEGYEQNEVWSAFRVGRRGHVNIISEQKNKIIAEHNGYQNIGIIHQRVFDLKDEKILIHDLLKGNKEKSKASFFLHFYPGIEVGQSGNDIEGEGFNISFTGYSSIHLGSYQKALGYNKCHTANRVKVTFNNNLTTKISIS